jgi:uncharacterized membrane protein
LRRVIAYQADFPRLVERAFEKIRQAADGMPAVMIRQIDALAKVMEQTPDRHRRRVLLEQADMIQRANLRTVKELADRNAVTERHNAIFAIVRRKSNSAGGTITPSGGG